MKLSSKGRYGLQAVFDLAFHAPEEAAQVKDICERQRIPPRFLEQVFQDLRRAGLVRSKRGPRGGYLLACPASQIRIGDVIRAIDGPVALALAEPDEACAKTTSVQVTQVVLTRVAGQIDACLNRITIQDMCDAALAQGLSPNPPSPYVYSI